MNLGFLVHQRLPMHDLQTVPNGRHQVEVLGKQQSHRLPFQNNPACTLIQQIALFSTVTKMSYNMGTLNWLKAYCFNCYSWTICQYLQHSKWCCDNSRFPVDDRFQLILEEKKQIWLDSIFKGSIMNISCYCYAKLPCSPDRLPFNITNEKVKLESIIALQWYRVRTYSNKLFSRTRNCLQCFDAVGWVAGRAFGL